MVATNVNSPNDQILPKKGSGSAQLPGGWTKHAPAGGITLGGKYFRGGQFIPNDVLEKATPEEIAQLSKQIELSKTYGPKIAKKMIEQMKYSPQKSASPVGNATINSVQQHVYVIDDGNLVGDKQNYGYLIIRNNPMEDIQVFNEESKMLNVLKTQRFDIITAREVLSIENLTGQWMESNNQIAEENIFKLWSQDTGLKINKIPLDQYTLLNNLSPQVANVFKAPQNINPPKI